MPWKVLFFFDSNLVAMDMYDRKSFISFNIDYFTHKNIKKQSKNKFSFQRTPKKKTLYICNLPLT